MFYDVVLKFPRMADFHSRDGTPDGLASAASSKFPINHDLFILPFVSLIDSVEIAGLIAVGKLVLLGAGTSS